MQFKVDYGHKVEQFCSDAARDEQVAGELLAAAYPNLKVRSKDTCHATRRPDIMPIASSLLLVSLKDSQTGNICGRLLEQHLAHVCVQQVISGTTHPL